jgi:hypothetical protein
MVTHDARSGDGFVPFFRGYAKSWVHAVAAAGMTAFGTLTIVHRGFAVLALAAYVVPPVVLYLRRPSADRNEAMTSGRDAEGAGGARAAAEDPSLERPAEPAETGDEANGVVASSEGDRALEWRPVDVPTEADLRDVCVTDGGTVHAVGEDGLVLSGAAGDPDWTVALADGPAAEGEQLEGVDATADGAAVWVAGDGGAVGRLEAETGRHTDYTAPRSITDNWLGVAVGGASGDETVLLINGSGAVLRGRYRDGDCSWDEPVTPGSGSSLSAVALADAAVGYCCDTNDGVFGTADGGSSFDAVGPVGAGGTLEAVATLGRGDCLVSDDDGVVHRYDGPTWTPERVGEAAICGLARREGETVACDAAGTVHERRGAAGWERADATAPESLVAVGVDREGDRAVAVGDDGVVLERR